jgi:hypothetical protein
VDYRSNYGPGGRLGLQLSSETQIETSHTIIGSAKIPDFVMEGTGSDGAIITDPAISSNDHTGSGGLVELLEPVQENASSRLRESKNMPVGEGTESRFTIASKSSEHLSENILLVPLMNPIKRKGSRRQTDDYEIYRSTPGRTSKHPWIVNNDERREILGDVSWPFVFSLLLPWYQ